MPHEYRPRQVVKPPPAVLARVAAAFLLPMVLAAPVDLVGRAVRATHPTGPASISDFIVAFTFVYEVVEAAHGGKKLNFIMSSKPNKSQNNYKRMSLNLFK
jgi:hypothetical protein